MFEVDSTSELNLQLFEIQAMPGEGKGLVARFNITKGARILDELPLFTIPHLSPNGKQRGNEAKVAIKDPVSTIRFASYRSAPKRCGV